MTVSTLDCCECPEHRYGEWQGENALVERRYICSSCGWWEYADVYERAVDAEYEAAKLVAKLAGRAASTADLNRRGAIQLKGAQS